MHWKRRRPKWPYLVALCCLLTLTVAAPRSWQQRRGASPSPESATDPQKSIVAGNGLTGSQKYLAPALPPGALEPTGNAPAPQEAKLSGPVIADDDYVAVDEPLTPDPTTPATGATPRSGNRSILVRSVPAPPAVATSPFSTESLANARDALLALVEKVRQFEPPATTPAPARTPAPANPSRVVVQSENDRLAMVPQLADPEPPAAAVLRPAVPDQPALRYRPTALIAELEAIEASGPPQAARWAREVLDRVETLTTTGAFDPRSTELVAELKNLASLGFNYSLSVPDPAAQTAWLRASRALDRRLPVWQLLVDPQFARDAERLAGQPSGDYALVQALHEVGDLTAGSEEGAAWRAYLRLDELADLTSVGGGNYAEVRRAAARDVLTRLADPWRTPAQREYVAQPPINFLALGLRSWATGEASLEALAALIERYESARTQRDAAAIAELRLRMKYAADARLVALAEDLNRHYRNANMRVALSSELLNRMIPPQAADEAPVRERIAGADVRGHSQTNTELYLRLLPDPTVWRFGLEIHGDVHSRTQSQTWPARLNNASHMQYDARKLILVNRYGLHMWPAEAQVEGRTQLVGVDTEFDRIPIVRGLVANAAEKQHDENKARGLAQVKSRVHREARDRINNEADMKLRTLDEKFRGNIVAPLSRVSLAAEPLDMSTTEERVTTRIRLAGEHQLAAHTPRPSAPSDSLASVQLHESAINNALRGLGLDGQRMTVDELKSRLAEKIRRTAEGEPAELPDRAKVEFAAHDAVRVSCQGDRIELILNIVELRRGRDSIRNVGVHAFFRPVIDGIELKLVRDGSLQFRGAHLRTGPRMVLHSVFGKLLPKDQQVPVLAARLQDDPRLDGLMVTQLVIDDGWVAASVGPVTPQRTAWRTRGAASR